MKFYYNNTLVRTSKTHNYTHAIITENESGIDIVYACASSYELAKKRYDSEMNNAKNNLEFCKALLNAKENNKKTFMYKGKSKSVKEYQYEYCTIENLKKNIDSDTKYINAYYHNAKIVELEAKA